MNKYSVGAIALAALMAATTVQAADRKVMLPIDAAMAANNAAGRLGNTVKYYFGSQKSPAVVERIDIDHTNQKTNAFAKSDTEACNWAFLSAMLQLQKHAAAVGANAVVNIVSNYHNVAFSSDTEYECHVGALMAGVALKGEFVKIKE